MSVDQPIQFNVVIIFAKRIDKDLSNFQPTHIEAKLKRKKIINKMEPRHPPFDTNKKQLMQLLLKYGAVSEEIAPRCYVSGNAKINKPFQRSHNYTFFVTFNLRVNKTGRNLYQYSNIGHELKWPLIVRPTQSENIRGNRKINVFYLACRTKRPNTHVFICIESKWHHSIHIHTIDWMCAMSQCASGNVCLWVRLTTKCRMNTNASQFWNL